MNAFTRHPALDPQHAKRGLRKPLLKGVANRFVVLGGCAWLGLVLASAALADRTLRVTILDGAASGPVPCRVHLEDASGKPVRVQGLPFWNDHFVCAGRFEVVLAEGVYSYAIERGPEHARLRGQLDLSASEEFTLHMNRLVDLPGEGWWPGDLHVHRPSQDVPLLMQAEDLHVAPVITWWNKTNPWKAAAPPEPHLVQFDGNRFYDLLAGEDEREGGALLYFHLDQPIPITEAEREFPSPMTFVAQARRRPRVWIDIEKPFWWDVPVWVASGQMDSIGLANNHMCRGQMYESEAWGRPRDVARLPPPRGNGFWTQEIYYHLLNCGIRLPPSAGSASGVLPNPVGYNRVYVHVEGPLTYEKWWTGLRAGRCFVSNGPLIRCRANGQLPGHVFTAEESLTLDLTARITSADPISAIEIIQNGIVAPRIPFSAVGTNGSLGQVRFDRSGWFLVRTIADNPETFRFGSTAPFYVEIGGQKPRVSRASAQFFLDWVEERMRRVKLADPVQRESVLAHHRQAAEFWTQKVAEAGAE